MNICIQEISFNSCSIFLYWRTFSMISFICLYSYSYIPIHLRITITAAYRQGLEDVPAVRARVGGRGADAFVGVEIALLHLLMTGPALHRQLGAQLALVLLHITAHDTPPAVGAGDRSADTLPLVALNQR